MSLVVGHLENVRCAPQGRLGQLPNGGVDHIENAPLEEPPGVAGLGRELAVNLVDRLGGGSRRVRGRQDHGRIG